MRLIIAAVLAAWCSVVCAANGTFTADGNIQSQNLSVDGPTYVQLKGTWGSGTVIVQVKGADGAWRTITNTSTTADADIFLDFPGPINVSLTLSGSTSPSLYWEIRSNKR